MESKESWFTTNFLIFSFALFLYMYVQYMYMYSMFSKPVVMHYYRKERLLKMMVNAMSTSSIKKRERKRYAIDI